MFKLARRWWRYLTAKLTGSFNERADPKVQLEQAIGEAQEQHLRLKEQAANVIANQRQTELRLNRRMEELEKLNGQARQAVLMADDANRRGDTGRTLELTRAAETIATQLVTVEREVEDLKSLALASSQAADQAKQAVQQNANVLQQKLSEKQKLMGQLDQAKMQEQLNAAMSSLSETVGQDVPTFNEVRDKIEARYAKAKGLTELNETSVESRMFEIQQATENAQATARLDQIRAQLGIAPASSSPPAAVAPAGETPAVTAGEPASAPSQAAPGAPETERGDEQGTGA
jgi:phage shock protein A